jgi:uncharacterized sodium:solute symporter family permease YidK
MTQIGITHRTLGSLDVAIIAAVVFAIGFYFSRKERTSSDYFLAGRNIGWFAIGASLFVSAQVVGPHPRRRCGAVSN